MSRRIVLVKVQINFKLFGGNPFVIAIQQRGKLFVLDVPFERVALANIASLLRHQIANELG
jgi:hypothetical protein